MESTLVMFKEGIFNAFHDWLKKHEEVIGGWYDKLLKLEKEAWDSCTDAVKTHRHSPMDEEKVKILGALNKVRKTKTYKVVMYLVPPLYLFKLWLWVQVFAVLWL